MPSCRKSYDEIVSRCVNILRAADDLRSKSNDHDEAAATVSLEKAKKIYGGHMGGALEEHGIWGHPEVVIDKIGRHIELGCTSFMIEFFGRDTTAPARLFAEKVMPAFRS